MAVGTLPRVPSRVPGQQRHGLPIQCTSSLARATRPRSLRSSSQARCNGRGAATPAPTAPLRTARAPLRSLHTPCAASPQAKAPSAADAGTLERLLSWALANGVLGLGAADSKIALYEEDDGERGVVCVEPIAAGEVFLRVPLRLAITDAPGSGGADSGDDARLSVALPGGGARWQDRLAAKLLRIAAQGPTSPWHPYIQALPKRVPSALDTFASTPGALEAVEYPPAIARIEAHPTLMAAKWREATARCPEAIGGADLERFRWAHTCVMSRTFGNAAPGGGIGVRMMVPLVDMLNHAGDRTEGLLSEEPLAADNVRWDVLSPTNAANGTGEWEMAVSAKRDVEPGEPLALSYFEGSNDEFLLHYGFVPPCNPHDEVELAPNLQAALEQLWSIEAAAAAGTTGSTSTTSNSKRIPISISSSSSSGSNLASAYLAALSAGQEALRQEVEEALARTAGGAGSSAAGAAAESAAAASEAAEATIESLEVIKVASGSRISNSLVAALEALAPTSEEVSKSRSGSGNSSSSSSGGSGGAAGSRVEFLVAALCWLALRAMPTPLVVDLAALLLDGAETADADGGAAASAAATQLLHYHGLLSSNTASSGASSGGSSGGGTDGSSLLALARGILEGYKGARAAEMLSPPIPYELRTAVSYRAAKKMGLVDVIAAVAAARRESIVDLQASLEAWAAAAGGGGAPPPPWRAGLLFDAGLPGPL